MIFESDNADNSRNNLLPVFAPFLCAKYGINLDIMVLFETQAGKEPVDVHFATAMMHVDRYIEERKLDVVKPEELFAAINQGLQMRGRVGELFDVNEKNDQETAWLRALKWGASEGGLSSIGRCNTIRCNYP